MSETRLLSPGHTHGIVCEHGGWSWLVYCHKQHYAQILERMQHSVARIDTTTAGRAILDHKDHARSTIVLDYRHRGHLISQSSRSCIRPARLLQGPTEYTTLKALWRRSSPASSRGGQHRHGYGAGGVPKGQ